MDGFGPTQIAKQLAAREVLTPAAYFESRGIDRETAEKIMAYAAVERLIHMAEDSEFAAEVEEDMGIKTDTEE